ncbi:permease family-domain-containing protein [Phyllosticta citriasiana]|uniref:Permease family-domain-containing protein n=1 Tax=Phyllosticta citriasiana TaxID=595635 RepID=A0ABR1KWF7_9PEZI
MGVVGTGGKGWGSVVRGMKQTFFTKEGLLGNYDYGFLFRPNLPFMRRVRRAAPFFGLNESMPVFLAILLGFQHALAMLAGVITPPIILASTANFTTEQQRYLVSTSLIVSGILSAVQITRFHIYKTPYHLGTGLLSVVGTSFSTITVASGALSQMYNSSFCPTDDSGNKLPCPQGYGAIIGTAALCGLLEVFMSFLPPRTLKRLFPPIVTGPTVMLIGVSLIQTGFEDWAGGSGDCFSNPVGASALCPSTSAPRPLPWGSPEFIGLGFLVFVTIIVCERFGSPIMKSTAVVIGLLTGCVVAAACGYFDRSTIDASPAASFIWTHTFPLRIHGPLVLPLLAVYIVCAMEAIGDITATCDVSRLPVHGETFDSRIQGGVLADGLNSIIAALATMTPMSVFAQNNGVIALTRCANRAAGYAACAWLVLMGVFAKFAAALVAIPSPVLGGMTTFLFASVAVSGMRIVATVPFTRRNRFILAAGLALGYGATLVPTWFANVFPDEQQQQRNQGLQGFFDAIVLVLETGFAVGAFVTCILNLILPEEEEEEEADDEVIVSVVESEVVRDEDDAVDVEKAGSVVKGANGDAGAKGGTKPVSKRVSGEAREPSLER